MARSHLKEDSSFKDRTDGLIGKGPPLDQDRPLALERVGEALVRAQGLLPHEIGPQVSLSAIEIVAVVCSLNTIAV